MTTGFRSNRVPALLAFLLLRNGAEVRREEIADALWPQLLPDAARNNLRVTLRYLKQNLESHGLERGLRTEERGVLALDPVAFPTDLAAFESLHRGQRDEEALAAAQGELLPGLYDAWIEPFRNRFRIQRAESALRLARNILDATPSRALELSNGLLEEELFVPEANRIITEAKARLGLPTSSRRSQPLPERTRFYGRKDELDVIHEWSSGTDRLLTVYGPGGIGKTRLGSEAIASLTGRQIYRIDVAGATQAGTLLDTIAAGVGSGGAVPGSALEQITAVLHGKRALIVLDNVERVPDEELFALDELLVALSDAQILSLSRKTLGLTGERTLRLDPLPLPAHDRDTEAPALAMFLDRAGNLAVNEDLLALARELEGVPLAIELAAAKTSTLSVRELLSEMHARLDVLVGRGAKLARHRTMRAALDWSFDLLEPETRDAILDLATLENGWSIEAAAALRGPDHPLTTLEVLEVGCTHSLLVRSSSGSESRYRMLQCTREYALEELPPSRREWLRARHTDHFTKFARTATFAQLEREQPNLQAALETLALRPEREADLVAFSEALLRYWTETSAGRAALRVLEGISPASQTLGARLNRIRAVIYRSISAYDASFAAAKAALAETDDPSIRVPVLTQLCRVLRILGRIEEADEAATQALALARDEAPLLLADAMLMVCQIRSLREVDPASYHLSRRVLEIAEQVGDPYFLDEALDTVRIMHFRRGELDQAETIVRRQEAIPLPVTAARSAQRQVRLGQIAITRGDIEEGRDRFAAALAAAREAAHPWWMGQSIAQLGDAYITLGDFAAGRQAHQEGYELRIRTGERRALGSCLRGLGMASYGLGEYERAAEELKRARRIAIESEDEFSLATVLMPLAPAWAAAGRRERATETLREMIELCERLEKRPDLLRELNLGAQVEEARTLLAAIDH